jgi:Glycosyl-4,4'-diaponeurosporenoate acyltransferase
MNQLLNLVWTIICFAAVFMYWLKTGPIAACWWFISVSFLGLVVPAKWLQVSRDPKFYERLGTKLVRKFVQNGDYAKRGRRVVSNKTNAILYSKTILMYEKYHFLCLLFFLFTSIHAILFDQYLLAALIFLANVIYNIYPMLLQQYNRARILRIS